MAFMEQPGQVLRFSAFFSASKTGRTGLVSAGTITVDVYGPSGTISTNAIPTELGGGWYSYTLAGGNTSVPGNYLAVFKTTDNTCDMLHVPDKWNVGANWVNNVDQPVSSRSTLTATGVWTYTNRNLTDYGISVLNPTLAPVVNTTGGGTTGGSLPLGQYNVRYTFINPAGETAASPAATFTITAGNIPRVTLPALPAGVTGMNIYLSPVAGLVGSETLYQRGVTTLTTDLSTAPTAGQPSIPNVNTTNDLITKIWTASARSLTSFGFQVVVGTNYDKMGYQLAPNGLDAITVNDPGPVSTTNTLPKMIIALWRYFYKRTTATLNQLRTYKDDEITVNTTMPLSNDGTTQTKGSGI